MTRVVGAAVAPDHLRPPSLFDTHAAAYKDWLHVNVVDPGTGVAGLVNVSLHGPPGDARSRAVGAALFHHPAAGWVGNLVVRGRSDAAVAPTALAVEGVAVSVDHRNGLVHAGVALDGDGLHLEVTGAAVSRAFSVPHPMPLGTGWIGWYVVPVLSVRGRLVVAGETIDLGGALAYHDHNWGRWHWGDDFGWDWGCFLAVDGPSYVLARTSDRARRRPGEALLLVLDGARRRVMRGPAVRVETAGRLPGAPRRLPGALAALHAGRARPDLPASLRVVADDGHDRVELTCAFSAAAQLITGDPVRRGYSFLHESTGRFDAVGRVAGATTRSSGMAVVERVD